VPNSSLGFGRIWRKKVVVEFGLVLREYLQSIHYHYSASLVFDIVSHSTMLSLSPSIETFNMDYKSTMYVMYRM
jgi:dimeric dUTPase (all-alpha-NTP-PPase superfamily)